MEKFRVVSCLFGRPSTPKFPTGIQLVPTGSDQNLRGTAKTSSKGGEHLVIDVVDKDMWRRLKTVELVTDAQISFHLLVI